MKVALAKGLAPNSAQQVVGSHNKTVNREDPHALRLIAIGSWLILSIVGIGASALGAFGGVGSAGFTFGLLGSSIACFGGGSSFSWYLLRA